MKRTKILKAFVLATSLPLLYLADFSPDAPFGFTLVREAHAVVGAPLTPVSAAGVARRTTRRTVAATSATATTQQQQAATAQQQAPAPQPQQAQAATPRPAGAPATGSIVSALPAGCVPETKGGVEYQKCGGVYYRAAFQGENLVYVVQ
jgi:hypothetical protein